MTAATPPAKPRRATLLAASPLVPVEVPDGETEDPERDELEECDEAGVVAGVVAVVGVVELPGVDVPVPGVVVPDVAGVVPPAKQELSAELWTENVAELTELPFESRKRRPRLVPPATVTGFQVKEVPVKLLHEYRAAPEGSLPG